MHFVGLLVLTVAIIIYCHSLAVESYSGIHSAITLMVITIGMIWYVDPADGHEGMYL